MNKTDQRFVSACMHLLFMRTTIQGLKDDSVGDLKARRRPFSSVGSRRVHNEKKFRALADDDGSDYEEEEVYLMKKEQDVYPIRGQPGMWYKVSTSTRSCDLMSLMQCQ